MRRNQLSLSARAVVVSITVLLGCGAGGSDAGSEDSSTTDDDSTGMTPTTEGPSDPTTGPTTESSSGSTTEAMPTTEGTTDSGTTTGGDRVCAADARDSPCVACTKEMCCPEYEACVAANDNCACVLDCAAELENPQGMDLMMCASGCGVDHEAMAQLLELLECGTACDGCSSGSETHGTSG